MPDRYEVYKCDICGNVVELLDGGKGQLVCCGEPMKLQEEQTAEMATEKHVPVVEEKKGKVQVTVGSTLHPMVEKHYIQWIEVMTDEGTYIKFLKPGDEPKAAFDCMGKIRSVREYCNVHKLWKN